MHLTNMAKATVIALVVLMASFTLMALPAKAQTTVPTGVTPTNVQEGGGVRLPAGVTPDLTVPTTAYLSFRPNPVGVGQSILVNMWVTPPLHVSRYHTGYTITITKPDGTKDVKTLNSYSGDTTGWFEYMVDQVGTWKLKFDMPGSYFPAGNYSAYDASILGPVSVSFTKSCYYQPSSTTEQTLIVQNDQVMSWPPSPLPTDYWTRPVSPDNREWWPILGNYPGTGTVGGGAYWPADTNTYMSNYKLIPYVQAPATSHIVWKRLGAVAGLMGGAGGPNTLYTQNEITLSAGTPSVIFAGRCYQTMTVPINGVPTNCAVCYDLRTGQQYYSIPISQGGVTPSYVAYPGDWYWQCVAGGGVGATARLFTIANGNMIWIDPTNGGVIYNSSIAPLRTATYYDSTPFFYSVQDLGAAAGANRYRLINWTWSIVWEPGGSYHWACPDIKSNISWPWSSLPATTDFQSGIAVSATQVTSPITGAWYSAVIQAASLKTGQLLWNITDSDTFYSSSCTVADHGKIAGLMLGKGYYKAWDLATGKVAWTSQVMDYPWSSPSFGAYAVQSAYGLIYREAYDGVYAFNWTDGKIVWHYEAPTPYQYETPYVDDNGTGVYSFNAGGVVADGKLYVYNTEHTPTSPLTRGWQLHCINATTGEGIWNITGCMTPGAIADGYLAASNLYDGYMYVFGKGQSATTVEAPLTDIPKGQGITIEGTVLDKSPAQPNTPCVSKESMTTQMEYLHMQVPIDGLGHNVKMTGVPVTLTAIAADGSYVNIGTVTTDAYHGTFACPWTPPNEGTYRIIASFAGDDSYGSSSAATAVTVGPAPASINIPEQVTPADYTMTIIGVGIAVIIAVAIAAVAIILIVRKR